MIILPYSLTLAIVGLLESLLTAALVDDLTDTPSSKNQEVRGQGIANVITGCLGGMAGCGMVGQSIINVRSGGRGRLSTAVAGAFLLFSIFALRDTVQQIPMAALVGVMIMVAFETFDWKSLKTLRRTSFPEVLVMPLTMGVTLATHNLAKGVLAGVVLSALVFGWQAAQLRVTTAIDPQGTKIYRIQGQLFFGSAAHFVQLFDYKRDPLEVVVDFTQTHIWDHAANDAITKVMEKYDRCGKRLILTGLSSDNHRVADPSDITKYQARFQGNSSKAA